jgi:hypothetical protein
MNVNFANDWIYYFSNLETESKKVQFEQDEGDFKVKIPFGGSPEGIEIRIHLTPKSTTFDGNYTIIPTGISDVIEGDVLNDGKCLEIHPQGFNQRKTWIFKCKTPTKAPSADFKVSCVIS